MIVVALPAGRSRRGVCLLVAASLLCVFSVSAQAELQPASPATPLNTTGATTTVSSVATLPGDGFVTAWLESSAAAQGSTAPPTCIVGRVFDNEGGTLGVPFPISASSASCDATSLDLAASADGSFVAAWIHPGSPGDIFARRFAADGTPSGPEIVVPAGLTAPAQDLRLAVAPDGGFMVAWTTTSGLSARGFDSTGAAAAPDFLIAAFPQCCSVASFDLDVTATGQFVIVWDDTTTSHIVAQRFDLAGNPAASSIVVNSVFDRGGRVSLETTDTGGFLAVWMPATFDEYVSRLFDASDVPQGDDASIQVPGSSGVRLARASDGYIVSFFDFEALFRRLDTAGRPFGDLFPPFTLRVTTSPVSPIFGTPTVTDLSSGGNGRIVAATTQNTALRFCERSDPNCDRCRGFDDNIDDDLDSIPDGCDLCVNIAGAQNLDVKPRLVVNKGGDAKASKLRVRGEGALPVPFSALAPDVDGIHIVLKGAINGEILNERLPAGTEWRLTGAGRKWLFKGAAEPVSVAGGGMWKVLLRDRSSQFPGRIRVRVRHKHGRYSLLATRESLDLPPELTLVFGADDAAQAGVCVQTVFTPTSCTLRDTPFVKIKCR